MFDGRISFDGIATVKNFVVGSYFRGGIQVKRKSRLEILAVTSAHHETYRFHNFSTGIGERPKSGLSDLLISF